MFTLKQSASGKYLWINHNTGYAFYIPFESIEDALNWIFPYQHLLSKTKMIKDKRSLIYQRQLHSIGGKL